MRKDSRSLPVLKKICLLLLLICLIYLPKSYADNNHYKNVLIGDRAATMGGAYVAISDDTSGVYYNPAGISFSFGDSVSGSGNVYHTTKTKYLKTIGNYDWDRESSSILPNFFGMTKKFGSSTFALSYISPDSFIEHQDQTYNRPHAALDKYYISLHSEDTTHLVGPSYAYKFSESLSVGASFFYLLRKFRRQYGYYIQQPGEEITSVYQSTKFEEDAYLLKAGIQLAPFEAISVGFVYSQTTANSGKREIDQFFLVQSPDQTKNQAVMASSQQSETTKYPIQYSLGLAWYYSPYLLVTTDIDYYQATEELLDNVLNTSLGAEYFLNANHAFRAGGFTNNDNRKPVNNSNPSSIEKIDMTGFTLGYSSYTRTSSFTLGTVYATGSGKVRPYEGSLETREINRQILTLIFSASYNY